MRFHRFLTFAILALASVSAFAVDVGEKAPSFEAKDDTGKIWKSSEHVGEKVIVLYFYPADMTGGCTAQACGYRDKMEEFTQAGVEVVGVSGDSAENHRIFKQAHDLNFTLLADTDGKVAKKFGVPVTLGDKTVVKLIDGEQTSLLRTATAKRWTFVIDRDGNVVHKDSAVKAKQDPATIEKVIESLK
ncbi:peroxiredoxin [Allorhodopirellula solitaria]|uniref:thioredoxin-dependent peroxiredoxin n=1 Tax=Allorhodopirellula solitaria TaxID=2527987 RepID=A0A5C5XUS8_9BACT|nr:peroxiredoxin [Allorhodopirellula solitaria]TWT66488.1 putative peroxiredoxin bcp [Allorhodopirellula solitaria]